VRFGLLGPLLVEDGERSVRIASARQRAILAALLVRANAVVGADYLLCAAWEEQERLAGRGALHMQVSRLRSRLGSRIGPRLRTRSPGYLLDVTGAQVDVLDFAAAHETGWKALQVGQWEQVRRAAQVALGLWRDSRPFSDVPSDVLQREEAPRLGEMRLQVLDWRVEAELHLGRHERLVPELWRLTAEFPLREQFHAQLMLALYRGGRQAEALAAFRGARRILAEELGIEPGPRLQRLHGQILANDPALEAGEAARADRRESAREGAGGTAARRIPAQLPADLADFTGRVAQVALLCRLLAGPADGDRPGGPPVAVVTGAGGIGKTALAVHVGHLLRERYPDGQLYADLRGSGPAPLAAVEVTSRFLRGLAVPGASIPQDPEERTLLLRSLLAHRRVMLVLDDARDSSHVRPLVPAGARCCMLVTSRGSLATLPGAARLDLDTLDAHDALALFERVVGARRVAAERDHVAAVLDACAGLPLALRIAGARLVARPDWSVRKLADRLSDARTRLAELESEDLAVRASFALGYDALPRPAARAFRLVAMLGGPTVAAQVAAALLGGSVADAERALEALVDARLLESKVPGRYGYHDLVRVFAQERAAADESGRDILDALERALRAQVERVHSAVPRPRGTATAGGAHGAAGPAPRSFDSGRWVEAEQAGLVATVELVERHPQLPTGPAGELLEALQRPLILAGQWGDLERMGRAVLAAAERSGDLVAESIALRGLGRVEVNRGRLGAARSTLDRALDCSRKAADTAGEAFTLVALGTLYGGEGEHDRAMEQFTLAIELTTRLALPSHTALAGNYLGEQLLIVGRAEEAVEQLLRGLALARANADHDVESMALQLLGAAYGRLDRHREAEGFVRQGLDLARSRLARHSEAIALGHLGKVLIAGGRPDEARDHLARAAQLSEQFGDTRRAEEMRAQLDGIAARGAAGTISA